jgi:4-hydroxybenzoate polyprenyltransferase
MARGGFDPIAILKLFRFPLVFTAIADSAAGYLIASSVLQPGVMVLLACCSSGLYFFGMALNDIADRERDRAIAPNRVLPSGRLSVRAAKIAAFSALALSFAAIVVIPDTPILPRIGTWALTVLSIVAYNVFLKIPPVMGLVRAFNLLLGVVGGRIITFDMNGQPWQYGILAAPALVYVTALTYVSTLEDETPSKRKVYFGVAMMGLGALLAALAGPVVQIVVHYETFSGTNVAKSAAALLFSIVLILALFRRAAKAIGEKSVSLMVRDGVGGIILLDSALLASCEDWISGVLIASLLVPAALSVAIFKRLA